MASAGHLGQEAALGRVQAGGCRESGQADPPEVPEWPLGITSTSTSPEKGGAPAVGQREKKEGFTSKGGVPPAMD